MYINSDPNLNVLHIVRMFYSENFSQKLQVRLIKVSVSLCLWQTTLGCLLKAAIRTIYTSSLNGLNYFKNAIQTKSWQIRKNNYIRCNECHKRLIDDDTEQ